MIDATAFSYSEPSVFGPLQNDLETTGIESPPDITSLVTKKGTFLEAQTVVPEPIAVLTSSCFTY